jgi:hypothetical protein
LQALQRGSVPNQKQLRETVKKVGPDLVEKDKLDIDDLVKKKLGDKKIE